MPPSSIGKVSNPGSEEELTGERPASGLVQISHFVNKQPETKMGLELEDVVVGGRRGVAVRAIAPGSVVAGELEVDDVIMAVDASPARSAVDVAAQMYAAGEGLSLLCIRAPTRLVQVNKQPGTMIGLELEDDVEVGSRRGVAVRAIAPGSVVAGELEVDDVIMAVDDLPARSAVDVAAQMYAAGEGLSLLCIRAPIPIKRREPPMKQLRRSEWSSTERCGAATKVSASLALNCAAY